MHPDITGILRAIPSDARRSLSLRRQGSSCAEFSTGENGTQLTSLSLLGLSALLPLLFIAQNARADAEDLLSVTTSIAVKHDDNLFRLADDAQPPATLGTTQKSDDITTAALTLKLGKSYSLQRFDLEASLIDHRYKTFEHLNFTAHNYAAAWRWSLTPRLHGNLSSDRKEALNSFSDYTGYNIRNLRTEENQRFDAVFEASAAWHLLGGIAQSTRTNSEAFLEEGDTRLNSAEAGLRHVFRSGSSLTYTARQGRGEFINLSQPVASSLLDNRFEQSENEIQLVWPVTAKTALDARMTRISRTHAHFESRDYSGITGKIGVKWSISEKSTLSASLARELDSFQSLSSSYISTDRLTLSPSWQISAKTALRGQLDYAKRDYRGTVSAAPDDRADSVRRAMLALEWQPLRELTVSASLQNESRSSNQAGLDYDSTTAGISAQLNF